MDGSNVETLGPPAVEGSRVGSGAKTRAAELALAKHHHIDMSEISTLAMKLLNQ